MREILAYFITGATTDSSGYVDSPEHRFTVMSRCNDGGLSYIAICGGSGSLTSQELVEFGSPPAHLFDSTGIT